MELKWDEIGERFYETGVEKGVLYPQSKLGTYPLGVAWNGLVSVSEKPSGGEPTDKYADNIKYVELRSSEKFGATIQAYTYPKEFEPCDGIAEIVDGVTVGQQTRQGFGLCYKTLVGNDSQGTDHGYKLHLVYGCKTSAAEKAYNTINESPDAITFNWEVSTTPVPVAGHKPTSIITIDSRTADPDNLAALEAKLYGTAQAEPMLPSPAEVFALFPQG